MTWNYNNYIYPFSTGPFEVYDNNWYDRQLINKTSQHSQTNSSKFFHCKGTMIWYKQDIIICKLVPFLLIFVVIWYGKPLWWPPLPVWEWPPVQNRQKQNKNTWKMNEILTNSKEWNLVFILSLCMPSQQLRNYYACAKKRIIYNVV